MSTLAKGSTLEGELTGERAGRGEQRQRKDEEKADWRGLRSWEKRGGHAGWQREKGVEICQTLLEGHDILTTRFGHHLARELFTSI